MRTSHAIALSLAALITLLIAAGCTSYYKVTDPTTGRSYYTTDMQDREGAVTLKDASNGQQVTIQNSEVKKVTKEEYETHRYASAQPAAPAPVRAAAPPPVAPKAGATAAGTMTSAAQFRGDLVQSKSQVDRVLASLTNLTDANQTDLPGAYKRYSDDLTRMNQHAERIRAEAKAMSDARDAYFAQWDQKVASTENPTIRADAEARRDQLRASQGRLATSTGDLRDTYVPFMKDLEEVRAFVAKDLSKDTTSVLGNVTKKAQQDGALVNQRIDTVISDLDALQANPAAAPR